MKILVFGAGVLGCNLAASLSRKHNVTLLARGAWADEIAAHGLKIKNRYLPTVKKYALPVVTSLSPNDVYDAIFVVVRYTQLTSVLGALGENRSENIIFVGNNVRACETREALPNKNVMFAFTLAAGHRERDRVVSINLKKITIGGLDKDSTDRGLIARIFDGTGYKVKLEENMGDYLLCHAAFVIPAAFACYYTDGDLCKIKSDIPYINKMIDANIEGYRAIRNSGHEILPSDDSDFESAKYRGTCEKFFKLMCATSLGEICASDHAMNAIDEMSALNRDIKEFYDSEGAKYPVWTELEASAGRHILK